MTNYISKDGMYQCTICGKETKKKPHEIKRLTDKRVTCSRDCANAKKTLIQKELVEKRLGVPDFSEWLKQKYWIEELPTRAISRLVYGNETNSPNILGWMERFGIQTRERSDAVALQWKDNPERREQQKKHMLGIWERDEDGSLRDEITRIMQSEEYKEKQRVAKTGELNGMFGVTGKNHPNWNPNLTPQDRIDRRKLTENDVWRKDVYKRDNYTCQVCSDSPSGYIVAHHLNGYHWDVENRFNIDNGITLCEDCHKDFHSKYGYGDNTKEQFSEYLEVETKSEQLNLI